MATGEDMPVGASINNRLVRVDVRRADLNLERITTLQQQRHLLPHAMTDFITSIRSQYDEYERELPKRAEQLRSIYAAAGMRMRQPMALAKLELAVEVMLGSAQMSMVVSAEEAKQILQRVRAALLKLGSGNDVEAKKSTPVTIFLDALRSLLTQGRVQLVARGQDLANETVAGTREAIGWEDPAVDGGDVRYAYLHPEITYRAVMQFIAQSVGHFDSSKSALPKLLDASGVLVPPTPKDGKPRRLDFDVKVGGVKHRTWRVLHEELRPETGEVDDIHDSLGQLASDALEDGGPKVRKAARRRDNEMDLLLAKTGQGR